MDTKTLNNKLALGEIDHPQTFPHLARLKQSPFIFTIDFGLKTLPTEPGILIIRGARQYGKSTWLEQELRKTIQQFGAGSAFYLNGDNLLTMDLLEKAIRELIPFFSKDVAVRRLFIDEITSVNNWEIVLKKLVDSGELQDILVVTTGSKATDLRRGAEKLPGRKGKLSRSHYLFTPITYKEFHRVCGKQLKEHTLFAYIISGGSPIACTELATHGLIPEYIIELVRDWMEGEIARTHRSRSTLFNIMQTIIRFGGTPIGQAKLAREANLANNTVAAAYIEILNDLSCIIPTYPWDQDRELLILRKPCKYHISNLLVATAYHGSAIRSVTDFLSLPNNVQAIWYEWLIAQELQRRNAIQGKSILEPLVFWQTKQHELDFVADKNHYIEVKRGQASPMEFAWFAQQHKAHLTVINTKTFYTPQIQGTTLENFLLNAT